MSNITFAVCFGIVFFMIVGNQVWNRDYETYSFYAVTNFRYYRFIIKFINFLKVSSSGWTTLLYFVFKIVISSAPLALCYYFHRTDKVATICLMFFILALNFGKMLLPLLWAGALLVILPSTNVLALVYYAVYAVFWAIPSLSALQTLTTFLSVVQLSKNGITVVDCEWRDKQEKRIAEIKKDMIFKSKTEM